MSNRQYNGYAGTPITYRNRRQSEDGPRSRQRQPASAEEEDEDPNAWTTRTHTSAVRYSYQSPRHATKDIDNPKRTQLVRQRRPTLLARFLVITGLGLLVLVLGIMAYNGLASWWQLHTDDVTYGRPRTYQTDAYVGHGDSPAHPDHFIALNLHGVVEVLEINPQNAKLNRTYYVTTTSDPLKPVMVTFPTVNGKQYMYVSIGDPDAVYTVAFVNDGKEFTGIQH